MRVSLLLSLLKWPVTLLVLAGLLAGAYLIHRQARERLAHEAAEETVPRRMDHGGIKLGVKLAASYGIQDQPARSASWYERAVVYGRVVPNPLASAEVRTAFAGILHAEAKTWPALGSAVCAGQQLGWVDVRFAPQERLDLLAKLGEAVARLEGAKEEVKVQQSLVASLKSVASQELIARGELDAALLRLAQAKTQEAVALATFQQWQKAREALDDPKQRQGSFWKQPLLVPISGEITEVAGAPGMALEAGAVLAKVVDFRRPLVRLDFPASLLAGGPPRSLELFPEAGAPRLFTGVHSQPDLGKPQPLTAVNPRPAPQVDSASQFVGFWYDLTDLSLRQPIPSAVWRPGLFVKAHVQAPGARSQPALAVPLPALLYQYGRPHVYVCTDPGRYERREVQVLGRQGEEWLLAEGVGVAAGERVVFNNAQILLSEEFRGDADND